ncbi:peroxynitrite isomerase THAP4-like [Schistocerca piceifrons]|uniref:peroxynitrite isomerase THAP4-like n=1 Tax=Schistocerca piceifrons TaxID=274613 RepID=UPI001F5FD811|nr:peroxynitrite isomerase THAP4-like [Schistocerca piceifrons]
MDAARRIIRLMNICRANWQNTKATALCKNHFTPDQFETNKVDAAVKLKPNAVPTIFCYRKPPVARKAIAERKPVGLLEKRAEDTEAGQPSNVTTMASILQRTWTQ